MSSVPITDIPNPIDYYSSGRELLNVSWNNAAELLRDLDDSKEWGLVEEDVSTEYWNAARRTLTASLAIAQQGAEFMLKGRIAEISPFLLIGDPPSKWPSSKAASGLSFYDLRTIDAQDLIKVLETFSACPPADEFRETFEQMRRKRNRIMHSADKSLKVDAIELIEAVLTIHVEFFPNESWPKVRLSYIEESPSAALGLDDFAVNLANWETELVIDLLKPAKVKKYLKINKKQRRYVCPYCIRAGNTDSEFLYKIAVLEPNEPTSVTVFCPVCDVTHSVTREKCSCGGNVIGDFGRCLTCTDYIE